MEEVVVKGHCGPVKAAVVTVMADPFSSFLSVVLQEGRGVEEDLLLCFPELFATWTALHELEELCKPIFSKAPHQQQEHQQQQQQLQRHQQQLLLSP